MSSSARRVDVEALVEDIQTSVAAKRANGEYPQALLDDLDREFDISAASDPPEVLSLIQSARPVRGNQPLVGPAVVLAKKVIRRMVAWYVRPIAADQTRFNDSITRELRSLERRVEAVESTYQPSPAARLAPAASRTEALKQTLRHRTGAVLLVGASKDELDLGPEVVEFDTSKPRIGDRLGRLTADSFSAVVLSGVLQRISGREIVTLLRTTASILRPGGVVLIEGPDPADPECPPDPSSVDISMRRWLSVDTVEALLVGFGFEPPSCTVIDANPRWYLVVAARPE